MSKFLIWPRVTAIEMLAQRVQMPAGNERRPRLDHVPGKSDERSKISLGSLDDKRADDTGGNSRDGGGGIVGHGFNSLKFIADFRSLSMIRPSSISSAARSIWSGVMFCDTSLNDLYMASSGAE